jgi:hypothetical protein
MDAWEAAVDETLAVLRNNAFRGDCENWIKLLSEDREYPFRVWQALIGGMGSLGDIWLDDPVQQRRLSEARERLQTLAGEYLVQHRLSERG